LGLNARFSVKSLHLTLKFCIFAVNKITNKNMKITIINTERNEKRYKRVELEEFVSDFLQRGSRSRDVAQVHINAFDVWVGLGIFDVAQDVVQTSGVFRFHRVEVEVAEGVVDRAIRDIIVKFHVKH